MKPALISIAAILGLTTAFLLGTRYTSHESVQPPPQSVVDAVRELSLQKTCAEGAALFFKSEVVDTLGVVLNSYTSHYSARLGRCFILSDLNELYRDPGGHTTATYQIINDAFSGARYGDMQLFQDTTKAPNWKPSLCRMQPEGQHVVKCHSQAEWNRYAATFMF